jgi:hypothetical protein
MRENSRMADALKFAKQTPPPDPGMIHTHSIVSHRTGRWVIVVQWNGEEGQFDPEDARKFAHTILRECDNAETDAFLYSFFKRNEGLTDRQLAEMITAFRTHRAHLEQLAGLRPTGQPVPEDDGR